MDGTHPLTKVDLMVCVTCRSTLADAPSDLADAPSDPLGPRDGERLIAALRAAELPENLRIVPVECLSNCTRGCTVALRGPGRWSYVYGNLDASMAEVVLDGAVRYAATVDGLVPWRERPEHFRKNCIARLPPQEG